MIIAALISFAILLVAWLLAPSSSPAAEPVSAPEPVPMQTSLAEPA